MYNENLLTPTENLEHRIYESLEVSIIEHKFGNTELLEKRLIKDLEDLPLRYTPASILRIHTV